VTTAAKESLPESDLAALTRESWVDRATADAFGLSRVSSQAGAELVGRKADREDYSGVVFPVYWPGEERPREYYLRRDHPPLEQSSNGIPKPKGKYLAPPGRGNLLLFGPGESPEVLADPSVPILLVEGLKKLCAAWRLARHHTDAAQFLACGISGSWNWRGTVGKTVDANGARVSIKGPIADLPRVTWQGRRVLLIFDSDGATNPKVAQAREAFAEDLRARGAEVVVVYLPCLDGVATTGFDTLCAAWEPGRVLVWLAQLAMGAATACADPDVITIHALPIPTFPPDVIPVDWLRAETQGVAAATETPLELSTLLSLGAVATTVQRKFAIEPEPHYVEPLNLWACVALPSGDRKSPVLWRVTAPLLDYEKLRAASLAPDIERAHSARQLAEDRVKWLRAKAAKANGEDLSKFRDDLLAAEQAIPNVPTPLRLWAQDVTPEKLGQLMAEHGEKMAILSDEGGIFDTLAGRYSHGVPNIDLFLQSYSGAPHRVDRGSRPPVFLQRPALTIALSPQPDILRGLAKIPGFRGRGFLARWFYALPTSRLGFRELTTSPLSHEVEQTYRARLHALLDLPAREDGYPHIIRLSEAARQEWKGFSRHVEDEMRAGGLFEHITDWAAKLPGGAARLAGVLHCATHTDDPATPLVSRSTMESALVLAGILEQHALAVFGLMAVDPTLEQARKVWAWILRGRHTTFSRRDCFKGVQSAVFPDVDSIDTPLKILCERGYILPLPQEPRNGRPSPGYRVNRCFAKEWQP
jgi:hypothetical protein